jgi:hypothetical protein
MSGGFPLVNEVKRLLSAGETVVNPLHFAELANMGLLHLDEVSGFAVLAKRSQRIANSLPNETEAIAAFFACVQNLRTAWIHVLDARLREAGSRRDVSDLCHAVMTLGEACGRARVLMPNAQLCPTSFGTLETELFGEAAHQAVVYPRLLRVIGATAWLLEGTSVIKSKLPPIAAVDPLQPKVAWCGGRVIQLPRVENDSVVDPKDRGAIVGHRNALDSRNVTHVLSGDCSLLKDEELSADDKPWQVLMRWALYRPWCMLLAQIVFTLEAWHAEQISGQMTLELAEDQISNPYEPKRVDVVVTTPDGSEILCGSLGQLVVRVLDRLQVTLLARDEEVERLDERLAGVIRLLLERKVWRFDPRGAGGSRPGYLIDDDFSTSCYRAFGSKYFYRAGSVLTAAIRASAEQWASEKQAKSREFAGVER